MKIHLSEREWVIGLYDYRPVSKPTRVFSQFHSIVNDELAKLGIQLTYVGIEGEGYTGKAQKANDAAYRRVVESGFKGITVLNFICNPASSEQPAYDRFVSASLSITQHNDNLLTLSINEGIVSFGGYAFLQILKRMENLHDWSAGYGLIDSIARQPESHVMGLDDGNLSPDELKKLTKWYCSKPSEKMHRIRSIYPINLLNEDQLQQRMQNGQTLREFAESCDGTMLTSEGFRKLTLWKVPSEKVPMLREAVKGSCAVIA